jgi:hypothetical protein
MNPVLSITIPTFNRASLLQECLDAVLPQTVNLPVEVVVIDNASPDGTRQLLNAYGFRFKSLRWFQNHRNLGYAGNQAKCIEYAAGKYTAILCDDDIYLPGAVNRILTVIQRKDYAFIALNYSAFTRSPAKPIIPAVGPKEDTEFNRAYDVMKHPSVGHYSGFVFNSLLAKDALLELTQRRSLSEYEVYRGVLCELSVRSLIPSSLPSFYIGEPSLAARRPLVVDYDSLQHLCLDYYQWSLGLHKEGLLSDNDLSHRRTEVLSQLPRALLRNAGFLDAGHWRQVQNQLGAWFGREPQYQHRIEPLLRKLNFPGARLALRWVFNLYRITKPLWWKLT